jgi:hypothetical protein
MKPVQVVSYSGYKADESPRILKLGDTLLPIAQIEDRWYSPGETFFRVLTQTGDCYLLRHIEAQDVWTLEGFRSHRVDGVAQRAGRSDTPLAAALFRCN